MKMFVLFAAIFAEPGSASTEKASLPPHVSSALAKGYIAESGGLAVDHIDRKYFDEYIRSHWRKIIGNIDTLPAAIPQEKTELAEPESALETSKVNFGAACDALDPTDYVEFLDKWIDLCEAGKISFQTLKITLSYGTDRKQDFLAVNWQHPRVKRILSRAISLVPSDERNEAFKDSLEKIQEGSLADNYLTNKASDSPFPETLLGIKLKRPQGMSPSDPRWREYEKQWRITNERIKRREVPVSPDYFEPRQPRDWIRVGVFCGVGALALLLWRLKRGTRASS